MSLWRLGRPVQVKETKRRFTNCYIILFLHSVVIHLYFNCFLKLIINLFLFHFLKLYEFSTVFKIFLELVNYLLVVSLITAEAQLETSPGALDGGLAVLFVGLPGADVHVFAEVEWWKFLELLPQLYLLLLALHLRLDLVLVGRRSHSWQVRVVGVTARWYWSIATLDRRLLDIRVCDFIIIYYMYLTYGLCAVEQELLSSTLRPA